MNKIQWSLVCPIKNEVDLITKTVPSFYAVNPSEVVLCFDNPPHKGAYEIAKKIADKHKNISTKFLLVDRNPDFAFHQSWVRRKGFLEAKYDRILTSDIDLIINKKVLKAIELVGKNNTGLVSFSKRYPYQGIQKIWRNITQEIVRIFYPGRFSGLYAIWRPYWLDSEDEDIKKLQNPKQGSLGDVRTGEDTYLRDCMIKEHRVVYLKDVGAKVLTTNIADLPRIQFERGRYFASQGYGLIRILLKVFLYFQFHVLSGWVYERRRQSAFGKPA